MQNENNKFQTPALIEGIRTLKDRTLKLTVFVSKEVSGEEKAKLFDLEQKEGWFLFAENELQEKDIPDEKAEMGMNRKTNTQRLYNVLYVLHQQKSPTTDFTDFRKNYMEKLIDNIKAQLE